MCKDNSIELTSVALHLSFATLAFKDRDGYIDCKTAYDYFLTNDDLETFIIQITNGGHIELDFWREEMDFIKENLNRYMSDEKNTVLDYNLIKAEIETTISNLNDYLSDGIEYYDSDRYTGSQSLITQLFLFNKKEVIIINQELVSSVQSLINNTILFLNQRLQAVRSKIEFFNNAAKLIREQNASEVLKDLLPFIKPVLPTQQTFSFSSKKLHNKEKHERLIASFKDLFLKPDFEKTAIDALLNTPEPIINERMQFALGERNKTAISAWYKVLFNRGYVIEKPSDKIAELINTVISGLNITGKTLSTYEGRAYDQYIKDFLFLLPPIDLK